MGYRHANVQIVGSLLLTRRAQKEVGAWNFLQTMDGLESFFMALLTRMLNWRKEEVDVLCAQVRQNLKDPKIHMYFYM